MLEIKVNETETYIKTITETVTLSSNIEVSFTTTKTKSDSLKIRTTLSAKHLNLKSGGQLIPCLLPDDILTKLKTVGYQYLDDLEKIKTKIYKKNLFNLIVENEGKHPNLVFLRYYNHSFIESVTNKCYKVLNLNYMEGSFDNANYRLPELREHLLARINIDTLPKVIEVSDIEEIPYYNRNEDSNVYIEVKVLIEDKLEECYGYWEMRQQVIKDLNANQFRILGKSE